MSLKKHGVKLSRDEWNEKIWKEDRYITIQRKTFIFVSFSQNDDVAVTKLLYHPNNIKEMPEFFHDSLVFFPAFEKSFNKFPH